ncbi:MAG: hypothetical protein KID04_13265 [Clostridium sp.]|nr:hypothetical protein [Clostridium sp.]
MDWDWVKVLVSPIVTFIAFFFTYRLNRDQNVLTRSQIEENARVAILPFLNTELGSNPPSANTGDLLKAAIYVSIPKDGGVLLSKILSFTNIGQATAVKATLVLVGNGEIREIGNIGKNETFSIQFNVFMATDKESEFAVEFEDLCGRKYHQTFRLVPTNPTITHFNAEILDLTAPQIGALNL